MLDSLYVSWCYLKFNRARTAVLVCCIVLLATLPLGLEILLNESERQLVQRAEESPLLVGARGSALDLVMNSLYFSDEIPGSMTMAATEEIISSELASPIPLYIRFHARGFPIVGTTLDYFDFRRLEVREGEMFGLIGQCVLGTEVARRLDLSAGDSIVSSPETVFDLAGLYPLKMKISGVLAPTRSADDYAIFVDLRTAWVIQGLGHGHKNVARTTDRSVILKREKGNVTANAKLMHYTEITADNIDSFHLHGDPQEFPLTAVLVVPDSHKSSTIFQGRYLDKDSPYQVIQPRQVIDTLMANIFKFRKVLDGVIILVGTATLLALVLVFAMSLRLREREIEVISRLGCRRATITRLLGAEIVILGCMSGVVSCGILALVAGYDEMIVRSVFI